MGITNLTAGNYTIGLKIKTVVIGDPGIEFSLTASNITFSSHHIMLYNPRILVRGTGVTYHSSFDEGGAKKTSA